MCSIDLLLSVYGNWASLCFFGNLEPQLPPKPVVSKRKKVRIKTATRAGDDVYSRREKLTHHAVLRSPSPRTPRTDEEEDHSTSHDALKT